MEIPKQPSFFFLQPLSAAAKATSLPNAAVFRSTPPFSDHHRVLSAAAADADASFTNHSLGLNSPPSGELPALFPPSHEYPTATPVTKARDIGTSSPLPRSIGVIVPDRPRGQAPARMLVSGPLTPGQVSFLLGFFPVLTSWIYSEIPEHRRSFSPPKSHSDVNLVELGDEKGTEDDRAVLLEGGLARSVSGKPLIVSVRTNLIRLLTMEEQFLLENRLLLRAMSELGVILVYFYICDRTDLFPESTNVPSAFRSLQP